MEILLCNERDLLEISLVRLIVTTKVHRVCIYSQIYIRADR